MSIFLTEKPSMYFRNDNAVIIFPSKPYWFSATKEMADIINFFHLTDPGKIISKISDNFLLSQEDAKEIYSEIESLLYSSGVLKIDEKIIEIDSYTPNFQVTDVENVLVIAATQQCNMSCPMCYAMAKNKLSNEMTTDEIKNIVDQVSKMPWQNNISRIALTGGEFFMRSDAIDIIEYVHTHNFYVQVNTNATLLTNNQIKKLASFEKLNMSISLDGSIPSTHDFIRGKGSFEVTTKNIKSLCEHGISVAINMFIHAGNIDDIEKTLELSDSLGVKGFNCLNMMNVGRGNLKKTKKILTAVPLNEFYHKIFSIIKYNEKFQKMMINSTFANQIMGISGGVKSYSCGIGTNRAIYVKADGTLYPCADTAIQNFCLGNLKTEKLQDIWENSKILKNLRSLNIDTLNHKCATCDVRYLCAGNCRGENFQTTKNIKSPHFKCDEIHDSIIELMWILTEEPDLFKSKVDNLYSKINYAYSV